MAPIHTSNIQTSGGERLPLTTRGLSASAVHARIERGEVNTRPKSAGKTTADIIRTNVCTRINAILGVLLALVITTGSWINCAFGLLIVVNSSIGIIQELRAKRTLESLRVIGEQRPIVIRDGIRVECPQESIVLGDVISLGAGQQIVVDGEVLEAEYLSVNESLLTGESDPVLKKPGDRVLSGSFVAGGSGFYTVTAVGAQSYAAQLVHEASAYTLSKSRLQASIDAILKVITFILIPVALATIISQVMKGSASYTSTVLAITGALVPMIPEGLILITSTAFALGVIRLGKLQCLVQELPAIEGLARVDVVCADKTGTLTENTLRFARIEPVGSYSVAACEHQLAQLAHHDSDPNLTIAALQKALEKPHDMWQATHRIPFTSALAWSAVTFGEQGTWMLGAPDALLSPESPAGARAAELSSQGLRILALAHTTSAISHTITRAELYTCLEPVGLVVIEQTIRADAAEALEYFRQQSVSIKVISGDNPASVAAVTRQLGISDTNPIDAQKLPLSGDPSFSSIVDEHSVFGRVRPDQKQEMVAALQDRGHTVSMTGDGVNDVLALKNADIGVAMGSGSSAARAVAKIVLLNNKFATLPTVVAEGRRVIANIERVACLFLTKTTYSALLAVLVIVSGVPFPFQPIHVTITGWFTIGIPAFILSLPPNNARAQNGFTKRVLGFAIPSGIVVGTSSFLTYLYTGGWHVPNEHTQQSTAALVALIIPSVWVLACVARPWKPWKIALFLTPIIGYWLIFTLPITQHYFMLDSSNHGMMLSATIIGGCAAAMVEAIWQSVGKRLSKHLHT